MFSKKKTAALLLSAMLCFSSASLIAYAETEAAEDTASTEETTEEAAAEATEAPEEITSGEFTYHIDEEYGGAVITAYEPKEKDVVLPKEIDGNTVVGLDDFVFNEQSGIETVTIPANLCHIGASAFYGTGIREFFVEDGHPMYKTEDGVLFSKDGIALVAYPPKKEDTSFTVPDGTEELYHGCFAGNTSLTEIELPDSLIYIDTWAFAYTVVQQLEIPEKVTEIGMYAFAYMPRITDIKTPPELQYIPSSAFAGCSNLVNVTLNDGLLEIGQNAFAGTAVRQIVIPPTVTNIGYCALGYDIDLNTSYSTLVIYGLQGSVAQTYAKDRDEEYDYENNFTFIAKTESQLKAMLSGDAESETGESEAASDNNVVVEEEKSGNSEFVWKVIIIALGGAVLCGGVCAVAVSSRKNKKSNTKSDTKSDTKTDDKDNNEKKD